MNIVMRYEIPRRYKNINPLIEPAPLLLLVDTGIELIFKLKQTPNLPTLIGIYVCRVYVRY